MESVLRISNFSIVYMAISAVLAILLPIALIVIMKVKRMLNVRAMFLGSMLFILFVMVLERTMHGFVLGADPTKSLVYKSPVLYMLYGGFAAGIFEEVARLLCFKYFLKVDSNSSINTGISYGVGHGGIEAILIGGVASVGNLITAVMLNSGSLKNVMSTMTGEQLDKFTQGINSLVNTPSYLFLITGIERVASLVLQIALSLFVFKAVTDKKWKYFIYAILIHAGIDMFAILYSRGIIKNIFIMEVIVILTSVVTAVVAFKISKRDPVLDNNYIEINKRLT